jgi:hypothetical protein
MKSLKIIYALFILIFISSCSPNEEEKKLISTKRRTELLQVNNRNFELKQILVGGFVGIINILPSEKINLSFNELEQTVSIQNSGSYLGNNNVFLSGTYPCLITVNANSNYHVVFNGLNGSLEYDFLNFSTIPWTTFETGNGIGEIFEFKEVN